MARLTEGLPLTEQLMSWFLAPSSTRATSLSRTIRPSAVVLMMMLLELLDLGQPAERAQGDLDRLAVGDRRLADLAGGDLRVLLADRRGDVAGRHVAGGELLGVDPDPHAVVALAEHRRCR